MNGRRILNVCYSVGVQVRYRVQCLSYKFKPKGLQVYRDVGNLRIEAIHVIHAPRYELWYDFAMDNSSYLAESRNLGSVELILVDCRQSFIWPYRTTVYNENVFPPFKYVFVAE